MNNSGVQRIVPIALVLIVIVIAVVALFSLGKSIFGSGDTAPTVVNTGQESLINTAIDRSVKVTVRGPIVADETHHSYAITATPTMRSMTTYEGYLGRQVETKELPNNTQGYEELVYALDRAQLMEGKPLEGEANDTRGICATGRLFEYEVMQASNTIKRLWTSTCKGSTGSLQANNQQVLRLFQGQIPDYAKLTNKIKL